LLSVPAGHDSSTAVVAGILHLLGVLAFASSASTAPSHRQAGLLAAAGACGALALLVRSSTWFAQLALVPWLIARASASRSFEAAAQVVAPFALGAVVPMLVAVGLQAAVATSPVDASWLFVWRDELVPPANLGVARWLVAFAF